jgi:hypothetical protein
VWQHNHDDPACSPFNQPEYTEDPGGYWDWADKCITWTDEIDVGPDIPPIPCKPRIWTDLRGNCWKIVCTEYGPWTESCGRNWGPLPPDSIKLLAVGFGKEGIEVKVGRDCGIETQVIPGGTVPISKVAFALMADAELPTAQLAELDADYWDRMQPPATSKGAAAD